MRQAQAENSCASLRSALLAGAAHAQIPDVVIPDTDAPPITIPNIHTPAGNVASGAERALGRLAGARVLRIEQMSRDNRAELERDPAGELAVRAEVVAVDISGAGAATRAREQIPAQAHPGAGGPGREDLGAADARGLDRAARSQGAAQTRSRRHLRLQPRVSRRRIRGGSPRRRFPNPPTAHAAAGASDSSTAAWTAAHQVFQNVRLQRFGCGGSVVPNAHGTAVAAILATACVGRRDLHRGRVLRSARRRRHRCGGSRIGLAGA